MSTNTANTGYEWLELTPDELEQVERELRHNHEPGYYFDSCAACVEDTERIAAE